MFVVAYRDASYEFDCTCTCDLNPNSCDAGCCCDSDVSIIATPTIASASTPPPSLARIAACPGVVGLVQCSESQKNQFRAVGCLPDGPANYTITKCYSTSSTTFVVDANSRER